MKKNPYTPYSLRNLSILFAEDFEFMQGLIYSMLKTFDVGRVTVCSGGKEAIEYLEHAFDGQGNFMPSRGIDIVITDWLMPEGSGLDLIQWIRNHEKDYIRFLPIILLSAFTSEEVVFAARNNGAHDALVKPVSGENLSERILNVIDYPRPFLKTPDFFGPDRRIRNKLFKGKERRKLNSEDMIVHNEWL